LQAEPPPSRGPEDEARRDRAGLLRAWESSPLTAANFCTLRRIDPASFEPQLAQARAERDEWQRRAPRPEPGTAARPEAPRRDRTR